MHEPEYLHIGKTRQLDGQSSLAGLIHESKEVILEQCLPVGLESSGASFMKELERPVVLYLPLVLPHFPLIIQLTLDSDCIGLRGVGLCYGKSGEVEVIEVLPIVPSETQQRVSHHQSSMSPAWLRTVPSYFQRLESACEGTED